MFLKKIKQLHVSDLILSSLLVHLPFKDEAQAALFKDPVRTAL